MSSDGLLKLYVKLVSNRISPVKYLVSIGDSFVRGLPVSHVQSAKASGSDAFGGSAHT